MLGLVLFYCLLADPNQCDAALVAGGFVNERQCRDLSTLLIAGWLAGHPGADVRRVMCAENPQFVLNAWKA